VTLTHEIPKSMTLGIDRVVHRVAGRRSFSPDESERAGSDLVKFLQLCAESDLPLAPSDIIDDLWHEFILHTRDYAEFCAVVLGTFVHHVPLTAPDPSSYQRTLRLIGDGFGTPDERFWPSGGASCDASCGSDCSS
jgi:hypothetical protein